MLVCPICAEPLILTSATCSCSRGHSFDVAREGYVNLLVGGIRGAAGDTKEMLRARRTFLERGFYAPLSERLNALAVRYLTPGPAPRTERGAADTDVGALPAAPAMPIVLDAGCGEGYYFGRLREALNARLGAGVFSYVGIDVAKEAARLAAKRYPDIHFAVADVKSRMPVADGSVALLLNVFAPRNPAEFARTVATGGTLLIAIPNPRHLVELRERYGLLGIEPEKEHHILAQLAPAFALAESAPLEYGMDLSSEDVRQLLQMTPNARHRERQGWQEAHHEAAQVTASFVVLAFRRAS
ncbi:MAG TPA: methyltransferase domain-containing protein [Ktedonobacterales bacterium]|nr:methyltransferase domain-containing protein [Ktedonobacterales bacterium]